MWVVVYGDIHFKKVFRMTKMTMAPGSSHIFNETKQRLLWELVSVLKAHHSDLKLLFLHHSGAAQAYHDNKGRFFILGVVSIQYIRMDCSLRYAPGKLETNKERGWSDVPQMGIDTACLFPSNKNPWELEKRKREGSKLLG